MKILITGGTGLIGRHLVRTLLQSNHEITVLTRNPGAISGMPPGVHLAGWNTTTIDGWGHLVDGTDAIINLAGESIAGESLLALATKRWTPDRKAAILESRVRAGNALCRAVEAARQKPSLLIQASAVGFYGDRGDEILTEDTRPGNDFTSGVCQAWEQSTAPIEAMGVRRAIIRTAGVVMSLDGGALPFMMLPFKLFVGGPLAGGKQWFSWIHIADEVGAMQFLLDTPSASGVFNLCSPQSITNAEFSKILGRVMHRPSFFPTPGFALRLAFGEKADILLGSQKQIPRRLVELGYKFAYPEAETALQNLLTS